MNKKTLAEKAKQRRRYNLWPIGIALAKIGKPVSRLLACKL